jgi:small redox-active disulfide protein 2
MKKIQVIGTGCAKCKQLADIVQQAAAELGLEYDFEKVTDPAKMTEMGVMITPALAVDGNVVLVGKVLPIDDVKSLLE